MIQCESDKNLATRKVGMKSTSLNTFLRSLLEAASVFHHIMANSLCHLFSCIILYKMYFTSLYPIVYLYFVWMWWDWDSPYNGGYASRYFLNLRMHKAFARYFPLKFHTSSELTDDKNYLIGMHPHGICGMSSYHFMSNGTGLWDRFPNINFYTITLVGKFWFPLSREWLMLHGVINSSRQSFHNVLGGSRKGQAVLLIVGGRDAGPNPKFCARERVYFAPKPNVCQRNLGLSPFTSQVGVREHVSCASGYKYLEFGLGPASLVGGASEALDASPEKHVLLLSKRKGFIKVALETGASLVPCFAFGENNIYRQANNAEGTTIRWIQTIVKKYWGISTPVFYGRGMFIFRFMPFRSPLDTVIGKPIPVEKVEHPTQEQIDELHSLYIERLTELYEEHKEKYGIAADNHLVIR